MKDPFLLCGKAQTDEHDLSASLAYLLRDVLLSLFGVKITVVRTGNHQRGQLFLPARCGKAGDTFFSPEKINGGASFSGEGKYHFGRFNARKAVREWVRCVAAGRQQYPGSVGKEKIGL